MEIGGGIFRKIAEAMLVPGVRVSNTSKKPPSRYGLIQNLCHHPLSNISNKGNARQIGRKIRHPRGCSSRSLGEETQWLSMPSDRNGLSLAELLRHLAEGL